MSDNCTVCFQAREGMRNQKILCRRGSNLDLISSLNMKSSHYLVHEK